MYPYIKLLGVSIPTYGLCICIAMFLGFSLASKKARKENIDFNDFLILSAVVIGVGMFGGCLLYILVTYNVKMLYQQVLSCNFSFLNKTGTVFYGGLISGVFAGLVTAKILKIRIDTLEKCIVPYIPLGHAIGRVGCLLAGCCYGLPYKGIFAVTTVFDSNLETHFPIQGLESLSNLLITVVLLAYIKRKRSKYSIISMYLMLYSLVRFFLEFYRGDIIRGSFWFLSTSQWISITILLISSIFMLCLQKNKKERIAKGD